MEGREVKQKGKGSRCWISVSQGGLAYWKVHCGAELSYCAMGEFEVFALRASSADGVAAV